MKKNNYLIIPLLVLTFWIFSYSSNAQIVYFNGLGRALVTNDKLSGNALERDTLSPRKGTGGYTLFDLGINVQPDSTLRASAILRVRNEFGGFYGDGASIRFRQLRLEGIIAKAVKYEIGDIDLKLTPYTLYNFDPSYITFESEIFAIRRRIVQYENFNFDNKWRLQGAHGHADLMINKGASTIGIDGFATRIKNADFLNTRYPDRLLLGGQANYSHNKIFAVGANYIHMFDANLRPNLSFLYFDNHVITGEGKVNFGTEPIVFSVFGEGGISKTTYNREINQFNKNFDGNFFDAGVSTTFKPLNFTLSASYKNVSPNFHSPGAQTRRIFDLGVPSLFPDLRDSGNIERRRPVLLDRYSDEYLRNLTIFDTLMVFDPRYNNIFPYGAATPNRQGLTIGGTVGDEEALFFAEAGVHLMSEVTGQLNAGKRKFTGIYGGVKANLHQALNREKLLIASIGGRFENTSRNTPDPSTSVGFSSTLFDAGLTVEVLKDFDLLGGYKGLKAEGTEFYSYRNETNDFDINKTRIFNIDSFEGAFSLGARYRFSKNTFFTIQWHRMNVNYSNREDRSYKISQLFLNYTMLF